MTTFSRGRGFEHDTLQPADPEQVARARKACKIAKVYQANPGRRCPCLNLAYALAWPQLAHRLRRHGISQALVDELWYVPPRQGRVLAGELLAASPLQVVLLNEQHALQDGILRLGELSSDDQPGSR